MRKFRQWMFGLVALLTLVSASGCSMVSQQRELDPRKHRWFSHEVRVDNLRPPVTLPGRYTVLRFSKVKTDAGIEDSVFSQQNLSQGF